MVAAINGHNGHDKHTLLVVDEPKLEPEPEQPKPCALRLGNGSWCFLPDGHEGEHEGVPPVYGPLEERPPLWREHKGRSK